jgi:hypothetical protein
MFDHASGPVQGGQSARDVPNMGRDEAVENSGAGPFRISASGGNRPKTADGLEKIPATVNIVFSFAAQTVKERDFAWLRHGFWQHDGLIGLGMTSPAVS